MKKSIYAGILIGLAGWIYLSVGTSAVIVGNIIGAFLFSIGLWLVCLQGLDLYTGKAGTIGISFVGWRKNIGWLLKDVLIGNIIGTAIVAGIARLSGSGDLATSIVLSRISCPWYSVLMKGIGCGMLMEFAVWGFREKKMSGLIFLCVPAFILSGMYHSIADSFYYILTWKWDISLLWIYPLTVIGNFIGCNVRRIMS